MDIDVVRRLRDLPTDLRLRGWTLSISESNALQSNPLRFQESIAVSAASANTKVTQVKARIDTPTGSIRGHLVGSSRPGDIFVTGSASPTGRVLLNARAPVSHSTLSEWVSQAIQQASSEANACFWTTSTTSFSPARPVPLHRLLPTNR